MFNGLKPTKTVKLLVSVTALQDSVLKVLHASKYCKANVTIHFSFLKGNTTFQMLGADTGGTMYWSA